MPPDLLNADAIADRVTRWRPLPAALYELLALHHDAPDGPARLVEVVASDPDLNRRMGVLGRISPDLHDRGRSAASAAIRQIGYRRIHSAAVATVLVDALAADAREFDFMDYWRNAAACGALAASLAEMERSPARDLAYAAGMLHRVGVLGVDMATPESLAALHGAIVDEGWSEALEEAVMGFTIREVTAALLVRWRLPLELAEAHLVLDRGVAQGQPLARVLWQAADAVHALGIPDAVRSTEDAKEQADARMSPEARLALDRFYEGGVELVRLAEGLIGACLLARHGEEGRAP